jgi:hypothetical protein
MAPIAPKPLNPSVNDQLGVEIAYHYGLMKLSVQQHPQLVLAQKHHFAKKIVLLLSNVALV